MSFEGFTNKLMYNENIASSIGMSERDAMTMTFVFRDFLHKSIFEPLNQSHTLNQHKKLR
jgi:hypothetical protein